MAPLQAKWTKLASGDALKRSSHTLSIIDSKAYIFGGELQPRQPRDNDLHILSVSDSMDSKQGAVVTDIVSSTDEAPSPRVGSSTTSLSVEAILYLFSGRGGESMTCIEEHGSLWLSTRAHSAKGPIWYKLSPKIPELPYPEARSYHAMCASPAAPSLTNADNIFVHAGCPASGRLNDLWCFSLKTRTWTELIPAPGNARGGASICFANGKLYRMNGFDGETEQGGSLDVYDPRRMSWSSIEFPADGKSGPGARSVATLLPVSIEGREGTYLVTMFGEADPSNLGHMGAGKMLGDVWAYSLNEGKWEVVEQSDEKPEPRGWFGADACEGGIVVSGGLGGDNERLDDAWMLKVSA